MKKKILFLIIILVILFFPVRTSYFDGGTVTYNALTYKIIKWHKIDNYYHSGYKEGTEIHLFPNNFKTLDEYNKDIHPIGVVFFSNYNSVKTSLGSYTWCDKDDMCVSRDAYMIFEPESLNILEVNKDSDISSKIDNLDYNFDIKIYESDWTNLYEDNVDFSEYKFTSPSKEGFYVVSVNVSNDKNNANYYFALKVK